MDSRGPQVIDKNIVDLLGLKDDFELSWEDYFRALREAAVAARMSDSKYSSEDTEVITEELKRVKSVDKTTVFVTGERKKEVKKNKVNKDKVTSISKFIQKQTKNPGFIIPKNNLLGGTVQKKPENEDPEVVKEKKQPDSLLSILINIDKTVGSILKTLEKQFKFDKKSADDERKRSGAERMSARERQMEEKPNSKGVTTIIKSAKKALSPLQELFSRIKNFLFWMFAAKAFKMFIDWFSDENNKKTFYTILNFLGDHWPLLLGSWLAFGTGIGRFITRFTLRLGIWTAKMAVVIAKKLIPLIGKLKLGGKGKLLGAAGLGLAALGTAKMMSPKVEKPSAEEQSTPPKADPAPPVEKFDKGGVVNSLGSGLLEGKKEKREEKRKEKGDSSQNFNITLEDKENKKSEIPLELLGSPLVTRFASPVAPILSLLSLKGAAEKIPGVIDKAKKSKKLKKVGEGAKEALKFGISPAYYIFNKFFANKKDKKKSSKIEGRFLGGITGAAGKALEYSPLGLMFKVSKFGVENLGKAASGAGKMLGSGLELGKKGLGKVLEYSPIGLGLKSIKGAGKLAKKSFGGFGDVTKKVLKYTPLGLGLSAGKEGLETAGKLTSGIGKVAKKGVKNTLKVASLPFAASLSGLSGVSDVLKGGLLKDPKIQSQFDSVSKKVEESGLNKDPKFIQMGGLPGLSKMILEKTGPEVSKQAKTTKFEKGGLINTIDSKEGLPITGAGKDDTLIKAKTGDAVLTEKDQSVLSKAMAGAGIGGLLGGPFGALAGGAIGAGISKFTGQGKETTIAVKKGEVIISPEEQQTIFDRFGIDIPAWLSKRKPQKIDSDKIKTKSGINVFNQGGVVKGYFLGGVVDGIGKAVSGVTKAISNPIGTVSNLVGGAIGGPFGNVLSTVGNIAGNFINPLGPAAGLLGGVGNIAGGIGDTIGNIAGGIGDTIGNITGGISNIAGGALSSVGGAALNTVLPGISPVTQMLGSGLVDNIPGLSQIKDAIGGLTKNLFKQGKDIQEQKTLNATQGTQITQQSLKNTMQDGAISGLGQQLSQIAGALGAAGGGGGGGAPGAGGEGEDSSGFFGKIGDGVDGFLGGAKKTIGGILGGVKDGLTGAATGLFDTLGKGAGLVGEGLKLGGQGVLKALEYSPMGLAVKAGNTGLGLAQNIMGQGQKERGSGSLMGGEGLKDIDNKNLPKTQIMTGPEGSFVGHLAYKDGKPVYQRQKNDLLTKIGTFFRGEKNIEKEAAGNSLQYYRDRGMSEDAIRKQMSAISQEDFYLRSIGERKDVKNRRGHVIGSNQSKIAKRQSGGMVNGEDDYTNLSDSINQSTSQYKNQPSQTRETALGIPLIRNNPLQSLKTISEFGLGSLGWAMGAPVDILHEATQMIPKKQSGGLVNIGNGRLNIQNPDRYLRDRYGIDVSTSTTPRQRNVDFNEPFRNLGIGMRSLGERARNLFSPFSNLFGQKKKKPRVTETSRKPEDKSTSFSPKGLTMENTGFNIPGATADRQLTALQPGEYVVPKDSVDRIGKGFFDSIVASTDSNSLPAKEGIKNNVFTSPFDLGLNLPNLNTNFDLSKVKNNTSLAFNPNINLNAKKRPSITDTLNELRGMRANSLERQGRLNESYGLKAFGTGKDFSSMFTKGLTMENTGFNIPGATADRQLTALQPGEYVIPKDSVDKIGKGVLDSVVRSTDSNSSIAKSGSMNRNIGKNVRPYATEGKGGMIKLPPIKSNGGGNPADVSSASKEIMFDATCPSPSAAIERERIQDTYGIVTKF